MKGTPGGTAEGASSISARPEGASPRSPGAGGGEAVALEARGVRHAYGEVRALDGIDLRVVRGEAVALVGESGSGKTTLLRCFNRLVEPDGGAVLVRGAPVDGGDAVALRRTLGYVPQEGGLMPHWNALRNAALVPALRAEPDARERARAALDAVGLPPAEFADRLPRDLSGGQRQRVAIARALAGDTDIVLLDEPFGALDAITRADLQEQFAALAERRGLTILLVTHDLREAFLLADRVAVMRAGLIEQDAQPAVLRERPATPYVRELLRRARVLE